MAIHKIKDFYPDYREHFGDHDILGYSIYSGDEKVGSVDDLLVDDEGRFRYLIINTGAWIFGKKVLLPIGRSRIDYNNRRVYVDNLNRDQVNDLPEYDPNRPIDYDYEEQVRGVYRPTAGRSMTDRTVDRTVNDRTADRTANASNTMPLDASQTPVDATPGLYDRTDRVVDRTDRVEARTDRPNPVDRAKDAIGRTFDRNSYRYQDHDPDLYGMNDRDHQNLRLYEERLIANKTRQKTGEVIVGKRVETEQARASVPVEKERVVVERVTPTDAGRPVAPGEAAFHEGEVARMEVYEEVPDIRKEAVVREEVRVRKEVDRDTVEANETLRRERLDVNREGSPNLQDADLDRDPNRVIDRDPNRVDDRRL